jgi:hypothetical protein
MIAFKKWFYLPPMVIDEGKGVFFCYFIPFYFHFRLRFQELEKHFIQKYKRNVKNIHILMICRAIFANLAHRLLLNGPIGCRSIYTFLV